MAAATAATAAPAAPAAPAAAAPSWPLDPNRPPHIEGFTSLGGELRKSEGFGEKFARKTRENPFVPLALLEATWGSFVCAGESASQRVLTTAGVLALGLASFRRGDFARSQTFMRARVLAQGFTLAALMGGVFLGVRG